MLGVLVDIVPSINWAELMTFSRLAVLMASRQGRALRCCIVVYVAPTDDDGGDFPQLGHVVTTGPRRCFVFRST